MVKKRLRLGVNFNEAHTLWCLAMQRQEQIHQEMLKTDSPEQSYQLVQELQAVTALTEKLDKLLTEATTAAGPPSP